VWIIDSGVYIRAFNDPHFGAELTAFHAAHLPRIILSAVVVFELLVGSQNAGAERRLRKGLLEPYQSRGRLHVPARSTWELAAHLDGRLRKHRAAASLGQTSFANDLLLAASARELGATIISENEADFAAIGRVVDIRHALPWPEG
jgi:predicted nucleic acid-binding protein